MRVAIYARVSKDNGVQDPDNQLHELRAYAQRAGHQIVGEYIDYATGKNGDRKEFQHLFEDARDRRFDLVLFWSLDRFGREGTLATLQRLQMLTDYGVAWRSLREAFIDSLGPFKDVVIAMMATLAKMERERLIERTKAGLARAKRSGTRSGKAIGRPKLVRDREKLRELKKKGLSLREIGAKVGISYGTVRNLLRQDHTDALL